MRPYRIWTVLCAALGLMMWMQTPAAAQSGYQLASGDQLRITVHGEEELSGQFQLDGQGVFSMPLIGPVNAGGLTARQLEGRVAELYLDGFLKNPQISIEVLNYRPFYILGEVGSPGGYPFKPGMTILNAAALAGGFTVRADEDDIRVTRGGEGDPQVMSVDTIVQPGDIIRVTERIF